MKIDRQTLLISLASGTVAIGAYKLLECLLLGKKCCSPAKEQSKIYEKQTLLDQYMLFNYSTKNEMILFDLDKYADIRNCLEFPKRVALLCRDHCPDIFFGNDESSSSQTRTALDIGCAVGRSSFELTKLFDRVIGIDYSANFVHACQQMAITRECAYECTLEGNLKQSLVAKLDPDVRVDRVAFEVGDACNLRSDLGSFDLVLASNLVCRLTEPLKFLNRLRSLVKPNGYVILSTPFTWSTDYTNEDKWISGYTESNGHEVTGLEGLTRALDKYFELRHELHLPMVIRETRRRFQYTVCMVTIWQRKTE